MVLVNMRCALEFWAVTLSVAFLGLLPTGCDRGNSGSDRAVMLPTASISTDRVERDTDWAQWRGGQAGAVSVTGDLPLSWDRNSAFRWKVAVRGRGNSSPVVLGDRIVLTSVVKENNSSCLAVLCFSRTNGTLFWTKHLDLPLGRTHAKNGYASTTAALDENGIYCSFGARGLYCLDWNGQVRWHVVLNQFEQKWGAASSPILFGNAVIQLCDGENGSFLAAWDKDSGTELWRTIRSSTGCWATPVVVQADVGLQKRHELIVNGSGSRAGSIGTVTAYDPRDGKVFWYARGTTDIPCPTAITGEGLVVSTSGANGPIFSIRTGGQGNVTESHVVWRYPSGGPDVSTGVIEGNRLFLVSERGVASCYQATTGKQIWKTRLRGDFSASLVVGNGRVYATSEQGNIYVFEAADQFHLLATNRMEERCLATPALIQNAVYIRTAMHLYCIGEPLDQSSADTLAGIKQPAGSDLVAASENGVPSPIGSRISDQ